MLSSRDLHVLALVPCPAPYPVVTLGKVIKRACHWYMPSQRYNLRSERRHHYNFPRAISEFNSANPGHFQAIVCRPNKTRRILNIVPYSYHVIDYAFQPGPVRIPIAIIAVPYNYTEFPRINGDVTHVLGENNYRFLSTGQFIHTRSKHHIQVLHRLNRGTLSTIEI